MRDPVLTKARAGQTIFLSVVIGSIYAYSMDEDATLVQNLMGSGFFMVLNQGILGLLGVLQGVCVCARACVCVRVYVCVRACVCACARARARVCSCVFASGCSCVGVRACICVIVSVRLSTCA